MRQDPLRFGVRDESGLVSSTWRCWAPIGVGKNDIYLANRGLASALKVSFHESGEWLVAYNQGFLEHELLDEDRPILNRAFDHWRKPEPSAFGSSLAFRILVPHSAVSIVASANEDSRIKWIPGPPLGRAGEILLVTTAKGTRVTNWPGARGAGTGYVGSFSLDNGETVWLVHPTAEIPRSPAINGKHHHFKAANAACQKDGQLRALIFGKSDDGSHWVMECRVEASESALDKLVPP